VSNRPSGCPEWLPGAACRQLCKEVIEMLSLEMIGILGVSLALVTYAMVLTQLRRWRLATLRGTDQTATA